MKFEGTVCSLDDCSPSSAPGPKRSTIWGSPPPARLRIPLHRVALFLDIDGTLAPITARPEFTEIPLATRRSLLSLQAGGAVLAALTGRPLPQARRLLRPVRIPCAGSHGAEIAVAPARSIRANGALPTGMAGLLEQGISRLSGVWLERKPSGYALHWRQAPEYREEVARLAQQALIYAPGWRLLAGHCVHELRPAGRDKGVALKRLMRLPAFAGRWPLAIGDDRTDEDAFKVALALGGGALRVGAVASTAAPWSVPNTQALAAWLREQHEF